MNHIRHWGDTKTRKHSSKTRKLIAPLVMGTIIAIMCVRHHRERSSATQLQTICSAFRRDRPKRDIANVESLNNTFNANLFPSRGGSRRFYLCSYPKTGCSQWLHLLNYLLTGEKVSEGLKIHERRHRWRTMLLFPYDAQIITDRSVPRILIMRNPYDRVLSAYHDFLKRSPLVKNISFHDYVTDYVAGDNVDTQYPDHRLPISRGCNIWDSDKNSYNIHWDYILKLEEMSLWSHCLFSELNLLNAVSKGWPTKSGQLFNVVDLKNSRLIDYISPIIGKSRWPSTLELSVGHERSKSKGWDLYTPELVRIVNQVFQVDFQVGGYALWDASMNSFRDGP